MSKAANRAKTKWNAANYVQVKIHADPAIATVFKATCQKSGVSMAYALTQFMVEYNGARRRETAVVDDVSTRGKRRKIVTSLAQRLENVRDAEETYMSNIPENLQGSSRYHDAQQSVETLDEVIELLGEIY